jgi:hypothetical protein
MLALGMLRESEWKLSSVKPSAGDRHRAQGPRIAVIVHMGAPCQRLIGDALAMFARDPGNAGQVGQQHIAIPRRMGRAIGAKQDQIGAQILHHRKFAAHPFLARARNSGVKPS